MSRKNLGKYECYLSDSAVKRWVANLSRGSPITVEVALRRLSRVCELLNTNPQGLLETSKANFKGFQDSLEDLVTKLEADRKSPGYILGLLKSDEDLNLYCYSS